DRDRRGDQGLVPDHTRGLQGPRSGPVLRLLPADGQREGPSGRAGAHGQRRGIGPTAIAIAAGLLHSSREPRPTTAQGTAYRRTARRRADPAVARAEGKGPRPDESTGNRGK